MLKILLVGLGGFLGSIGRYAVSGWVYRRVPFAALPWGTVAVNLLGCLVLGALSGLVELRQVLSPESRLLLLVGLLGGFTTFSTFGFESFALLRDGDWSRLLGYVLLHTVGGLAAVWLGDAAVRAIWR